MSERSKVIFGNEMSKKVYKKSIHNKEKFIKKFGDDTNVEYHLDVVKNKTLYDYLGIMDVLQVKNSLVLDTNGQKESVFSEQGVVVGNIRMGFGHYRISMAIASAANHMGYRPYWFDLHSFSDTTGGKVIKHLNELYSMGSRWSQKYPLFNKLYWEPLNSEGFKKLAYNSADQEMAKLMTPIFKELPKDLPFIATHVWPAQAAVHAKVKKVVNVIPDNWPMALHLAQGSIHGVQTPSAYLGYRTLKNMNGKKINHPIPDKDIKLLGHYIDHELVSNIEADNRSRLKRQKQNEPMRFLITVGGAGAQKEIFVAIIRKLLPYIKKKKAALYLNVGDHKSVYEDLLKEIPELFKITTTYFDQWEKTTIFAKTAIESRVEGVHAFYHEDIFPAVYSTNLLMRSADVLITKPSELSFYPIPKLLIKRVGGHEAYGAIRSSEVGDGTLECETKGHTLQMLKLLLNSNDILEMMCDNINKANSIGIYDGAYRAISVATGTKIKDKY